MRRYWPFLVFGAVAVVHVILTAWLTDIFFQAPPEVLGIVASGLTHLFLVVLFAWPLHARWRTFVVIPYAAGFVATVVAFWPALGSFAPLVIAYTAIIYAMAFLAARVDVVAGVGGALFVASALVKGTGLFVPQVLAGVPQTAFDAVVMALYTAGMGLVALGSVRRIVEFQRASAPPRRASARRWAPRGARRDALPAMR